MGSLGLISKCSTLSQRRCKPRIYEARKPRICPFHVHGVVVWAQGVPGRCSLQYPGSYLYTRPIHYKCMIRSAFYLAQADSTPILCSNIADLPPRCTRACYTTCSNIADLPPPCTRNCYTRRTNLD